MRDVGWGLLLTALFVVIAAPAGGSPPEIPADPWPLPLPAADLEPPPPTSPAPPQAAPLVDRLADAPALADRAAFDRGNTAMRAGRLDEACEAFERAARSPLPSLALRAALARAVCLIDRGDAARAGAEVRTLLARHPGLRPALELRARLSGREGSAEAPDRTPAPRTAPRWSPPGPGARADALMGRRPARAVASARRLRADAWEQFGKIPATFLGRVGATEAAMAAIAAGQAETAWQQLGPAPARANDRSRYWSARLAQRAGRPDLARPVLEELARRAWPSYYAVWAAARLREIDGDAPEISRSPVALDGKATGIDPDPDRRAAAARELAQLVDASEELRAAYEAVRLARGYAPRRSGLARLWGTGALRLPAGVAGLAARTAPDRELEAALARVARALGDEGLALRIDAPRAADLAAFHRRAWRDTVLAASAQHGVDPDLVWAVMLRESYFEPEALSHVGAIGLMQVMPKSGRRIARERGLEGFDPADLLDPVRAIDFGAYNLSVLLKRFDGRVPLALAAYNGGPHNVERWLEARGNADLDIFCEQIPFEETHRYVQRVLTSLAVYQAGQPEPDL